MLREERLDDTEQKDCPRRKLSIFWIVADDQIGYYISFGPAHAIGYRLAGGHQYIAS